MEPWWSMEELNRCSWEEERKDGDRDFPRSEHGCGESGFAPQPSHACSQVFIHTLAGLLGEMRTCAFYTRIRFERK